ncbi:hypothetical protein HR11_05050 [Porphyromonas macacae]|uniref:BlaI/MecI/CopY family transcriptional regulator n=1 Tax=Porphyromonas macacae TaxID=28115 RepID=UPI00052C45E0|nr:BlaI/MecI/CopY family transcriptional regulator [Porphyromonas macacae]KGN99606.1 hypothetical protein HR11_05050 [Porphyromonas macacae]
MRKNIRLTPREEEVMRIMWSIGEAEVRMIIPHLPDPEIPYTTIASIMHNLEKKEFIRKVGKGRGYIYRVAIPEKDYSKLSLNRMVNQFFTGDYKSLVQSFAEESKITADDLREIIQLIEQGNSK